MRKLPQIPPSRPGPSQSRVLVVDAELMMARVTKRILEDQGYIVDVAESAIRAFEKLDLKTYQFLIIDDSIDDTLYFAKTIRTVIRSSVPIIVLSDTMVEADPPVSAMICLAKPFGYDELVGSLSGLKSKS